MHITEHSCLSQNHTEVVNVTIKASDVGLDFEKILGRTPPLNEGLRDLFPDKKTIIFFNGPPGSGKDEAVKYIQSLWDVRHLKFATPLLEAIKRAYKLTNEEADVLYSRAYKDTPASVFGGATPRQIQKWFAEVIIKPIAGKDIFAQKMKEEVDEDDHQVFVFSDLGFIGELTPFIGRYDLHIVNVVHPCCDFTNDSRSYIYHPSARMHKLVNDGTLEQYQQKVAELFGRITGY